MLRGLPTDLGVKVGRHIVTLSKVMLDHTVMIAGAEDKVRSRSFIIKFLCVA